MNPSKIVLACFLLGGCAGQKAEGSFAAAAPPAAPAPAPALAPTAAGALLATAAPDAPSARVPTFAELADSCVKDRGSEACTMAPEEAERTCRSMTPTKALRAFSSPRGLRVGYLTRDMEAWSTARVLGSKSRAAFDEEVLVLASRHAKGGIVVTGSAVTYEILRYDGTCASLTSDEITFKRAPFPARPIRWEKLEAPVREDLEAQPAVARARARTTAACDRDRTTKACVVATRTLGAAIVTAMKKAARDGA